MKYNKKTDRPPKNRKRLLAKKHWGQNFLTNKNIKDRIISSCGLQPEDHVLEIGPGYGALTEDIIQIVSRYTGVEKDKNLIAHLTEHFSMGKPTTLAEEKKEIIFIQGDILKYDFSTLAGPLKVIGNLPYNISSPILEKVIGYKNIIKECYFTLQLEFGKRLIAQCHTKDYGALSLCVQHHFHPKILFKIPGTSFRPVPKVTSCLVKLSPIESKLSPKEEDLLFNIIHWAFEQRRKKILNSLGNRLGMENIRTILDRLAINENLRAENLTLNNYTEISSQILHNKPDGKI